MSGLDLLRDPDLAPEREEVKEPAKRWRNWWRALCPQYCDETGACFEPGDVWRGRLVFPTKDVAETHALKAMAGEIAEYGSPNDEYLGAFSDGEAP